MKISKIKSFVFGLAFLALLGFGENLNQDLLNKIPDQEYDYPVIMNLKISSFND